MNNGKIEVKKIFKDIKKEEVLSYFFNIQSYLQTNKSLKLTNGEIEILICILSLPEKFKYNRFSSKARVKARELLKEKFNREIGRILYQQHIYNLKKKGVIVEIEDGDNDLHPQILKMYNNLTNELEIVIKFTINDN